MGAVPLPLTPSDIPVDEDWQKPVVDASGCHHPSPTRALGNLLGLCACSEGEDIAEDAVKVLRWRQAWHLAVMARPRDRWWGRPAGDLPQPPGGIDGRYRELLLHVLDNARLLEHGGSVHGSWPTELGTQWAEALS